jgi:hypothetical protein
MLNINYKQIIKWAEELDQIFTIKDLQVMGKYSSDLKVFRSVRKLLENGDLIKIKRGLYATPQASLVKVSSRIYPDSYISTGTVLAKYLVIGSVPIRRVQAIKIGAPRTFSTPLGKIEYLSISPKLFFGFERVDNQLWASPEKALLDAYYFTFKGRALSFDLDQDVNLEGLDRGKIARFLKVYDPRFRKYFNKNVTYER